MTTQPNILFVFADQHRHDALGCAGNELIHTPNLDRLAAEAQVMEAAWSTSSWTLPGHASLFSSTYAYRHGARSMSEAEEVSDDPLSLPAPGLMQTRLTKIAVRAMDERLPVIAELLAEAGYRTGAIIGNYGYLARYWGLARGFEPHSSRRWRAPAWRSRRKRQASRMRPISREPVGRCLDCHRRRSPRWIRCLSPRRRDLNLGKRGQTPFWRG